VDDKGGSPGFNKVCTLASQCDEILLVFIHCNAVGAITRTGTNRMSCEGSPSSTTLSLSTAIAVPATYNKVKGSKGVVVFGHGLGSKDPAQRFHKNDRWIEVASAATKEAKFNVLRYTARGHGKSTGWESDAEERPEQFTWRFLAHDMLAAADCYHLSKFVVGGNSMGSATALYAAIQQPTRVAGLILIRPPTAWQERDARRGQLLAAADRLRDRVGNSEEKEEETPQRTAVHFVLRGTAYSDLPPVDSPEYALIAHLPTLILTIEDDPAHPVSTAEMLARLLPQSSLQIAASSAEAAAAWPALIQSFLATIQF
jgi:3-oxoadipate enol-lactonase